MMALNRFPLKEHCPVSLTPPPVRPLPALPSRVLGWWHDLLPAPAPPSAPNLGCAGFLLGQLLQLRPLLPEGVQHLLIADHLLKVPLVACVGGGSH